MTDAEALRDDKLGGRAADPASSRLFAVAVSALVASGLFLFGYNSLMGMAIAYGLMALSVAGLLVLCKPGAGFWRALRMPALAFGAALAWLTAIHIGLVAALGGLPSMTPDYFGAEMLGLLAAAFAMLAGMLLGGHDGQMRASVETLRHGMAAALLVGLILWRVDAPMPFADWSLTWRGRFAGLAGNANVTATVAGAVILLALAALIRRHGAEPRGRWRKWQSLRPLSLLAMLEIALGVVAMVQTASRFAMMGTVGLALIILLLRLPGLLRTGRLAVLVLVAGAVAFAAVKLELIAAPTRLDQIGFDWGVRARLWQFFADLVAAAPFTGYGLGSFGSLHAYFLTDETLAEGIWNVRSPHDIILQLMLNGGLPYLLLMGVVLFWQGRAIWRTLKLRTASSATIGLIAATFLILGCAMVDIVLDVTAMILLFQFMIGLLIGRSQARLLAQRASSRRDRQTEAKSR
jgi:O-antigen ligase